MDAIREIQRVARRSGLESPPFLPVGYVWLPVGRKFHTQWCDSLNGLWLDGFEVQVMHLGGAKKTGKNKCIRCRQMERDRIRVRLNK